jgi:hypothetical protein
MNIAERELDQIERFTHGVVFVAGIIVGALLHFFWAAFG